MDHAVVSPQGELGFLVRTVGGDSDVARMVGMQRVEMCLCVCTLGF